MNEDEKQKRREDYQRRYDAFCDKMVSGGFTQKQAECLIYVLSDYISVP